MLIGYMVVGRTIFLRGDIYGFSESCNNRPKGTSRMIQGIAAALDHPAGSEDINIPSNEYWL